jgi:hypothetical protein
MTDQEIEETRQRYLDVLGPLFLPADPVSNDIIRYFASLLRIVGMEDKGWDPYLESRAIIHDLDAILQSELPENKFPDRQLTTWRMGLLMYSHMVEMDAPYEVLTNLLRFRLGKGYSPNPYFMFLKKDEQKRVKRSGIFPKQKIRIIKSLAKEANSVVGDIFDEFYDGELRNAISHADYIITGSEFRVRRGTGAVGAYSVPLAALNQLITKCQIFMGTFFALDSDVRRFWGKRKQTAVAYDLRYKGLMEILVDGNDLMCGFKVHWPNNTESTYRRTEEGIDMVNCMLDFKNAAIECMVGLYARNPGDFSPLVESGESPKYTKIEGTGEIPSWHEG